MDARNVDIARDMITSGFLGPVTSQTYKKYIRFSKSLLKYESVREYIFNESTIAREAHGKKTNMTYFVDSILNQANEEDMLLMLKCVDAFFNNPDKKKFHAKTFYEVCLLFINEMKEYYTRFTTLPDDATVAGVPKPSSYGAFMDGLYNSSLTLTTTPYKTIINNMRTFSYSDQEKGRNTIRIARGAISRLKSKLDARSVSYTHLTLPTTSRV